MSYSLSSWCVRHRQIRRMWIQVLECFLSIPDEGREQRILLDLERWGYCRRI
jgi:hypothetical protein